MPAPAPAHTPPLSPLQIIREQMPQFLDEPHAREFRDVAGALIPQSPSELALEAVFAPVSKPFRLAALGASIAAASPDAEGSVFPRMAGGLMEYIAKNYPDATRAVRRALGQSYKSGNEWAVAHHPDAERVWSSGHPDLVEIPPHVQRTLLRPMMSPDDAFLMHTHPWGDVSPSMADVQLDVGRPGMTEIIGSADKGNPYVAFRRRRPFSGNDFDDYTAQASHHFKSPEVEDILMSRGLIDPDYTDIEGMADEVARMTYMRNLGLQDKLDMYYNDLRRIETEPGRSVPMADILETYWGQFHR